MIPQIELLRPTPDFEKFSRLLEALFSLFLMFCESTRYLDLEENQKVIYYLTITTRENTGAGPGFGKLAGWSQDREINAARVVGPCRENRAHEGEGGPYGTP